MSRQRQEQIDRLTHALEQLLARPGVTAEVAAGVTENLVMLRASSGVVSYLHWLWTKGLGLPRNRLIEVQDLLPEFDAQIHAGLLEVEQGRYPNLILPLVQTLKGAVTNANRPVSVVDLGAGAMTTERRVLGELIAQRHPHPILMIGVDHSATAREIARRQMASLGDEVEIVEADVLDLPRCLSDARQLRRHRVILADVAVEDLPRNPPVKADVVFHCFLRHHLAERAAVELDGLALSMGRRVLEYDGFRNAVALAFFSAYGWRDPTFLAATIFSYLSFSTRGVIARRAGEDSISFHRTGTYLLQRQSATNV